PLFRSGCQPCGAGHCRALGVLVGLQGLEDLVDIEHAGSLDAAKMGTAAARCKRVRKQKAPAKAGAQWSRGRAETEAVISWPEPEWLPEQPGEQLQLPVPVRRLPGPHQWPERELRSWEPHQLPEPVLRSSGPEPRPDRSPVLQLQVRRSRQRKSSGRN